MAEVTTSDEQIGANLTRLRGEMSQKELAAKMRPLGWKWSQATVWSIEKGERPLRLTEAEDVCQVLGVLVGALTYPDWYARINQQALGLISARSHLEQAIRDYANAQIALAVNADLAEEHLDGNLVASIQSDLAETPSSLATAVLNKMLVESNHDLHWIAAKESSSRFVRELLGRWHDLEQDE